jgi:hypothetical protein
VEQGWRQEEKYGGDCNNPDKLVRMGGCYWREYGEARLYFGDGLNVGYKAKEPRKGLSEAIVDMQSQELLKQPGSQRLSVSPHFFPPS